MPVQFPAVADGEVGYMLAQALDISREDRPELELHSANVFLMLS